MPSQFDVFPYSIDRLKKILSDKSGASSYLINRKYHIGYFESYFDKLEAQTIVVEYKYIDHDFLEDFAGYYVRCFNDYSRKCVRLHFFTVGFCLENMISLLQGNHSSITNAVLKNHYLGFLVIKPLPQTIIGRTCLCTYPLEDFRFFPSLRIYKANLFGISLSVETLAFQEQDEVVAACATSALWTAFHGTGKLYQHSIPSPVEITKTAVEKRTADLHYESRTFPNRGLIINQMAHAIKRVGLEPYTISVINDLYLLKSTLYAYLRGKIPVLFVVDLWEVTKELKVRSNKGKHAVTITGYSLKPSDQFSHFEKRVNLKSSRIDKIYVHDDQVGPFARMDFDNLKVNSTDQQNHRSEFESLTWQSENVSIRALPDILLVPVYNKIRIPFEVVQNAVAYFDFILDKIRQENFTPPTLRIEWDIYLTTVNDFKEDIFSSKFIDGEKRKEILTRDLPRFLWRATALLGDKLIFDFLFDATDIEQGDFLKVAIEYDEVVADIIKGVCQESDVDSWSPDKIKILRWFFPKRENTD